MIKREVGGKEKGQNKGGRDRIEEKEKEQCRGGKGEKGKKKDRVGKQSEGIMQR